MEIRNKIILLRYGTDRESYAGFKSDVLDAGRQLLQTEKPAQLKITLTEERPPRISVIPFSKKKIAAISFSQHAGDTDLSPYKADGAYAVTEAIPRKYTKDWSDGKVTPGIGLLTLFRQKKNLPYDQFIERWHNGHTPLSLDLHPLWNYNRNVVDKKLLETSPWYDGIVEEQFRTRAELLNPARMFGSPLTMFYHMIRVYLDVKGFIDYPSIETYLTSEYWIRS